MRKPKYTARLLKVTVATIDQNGDVVTPTSQEKLMDSIFGPQKYTLIQLYSSAAILTGNTKREITFKAADYVNENPDDCDYQLYFEK